MTPKALDKLTVTPETPLRDAMATLDAGACGVVLVVDGDGELLGLATDGDVRRAILSGTDLAAPIRDVANRRPQTGRPDDPQASLLRLMHKHSLRHMPIVDADGRMVDLVLFSELTGESAPQCRAVIMSGGLGTRLRPGSHPSEEPWPKPMRIVERVGKPLLRLIIEQLRDFGVGRIDLAVRYGADQIEQYFGDGSRLGVDIRYVRETEPLGTAGALSLISDRNGEPLLVMNADIFTKLDVPAMLHFHADHDADVTLAVRQFDVQIPYGVVDMDGDRIRRLQEKPTLTHFINAGIYVLSPTALDHLEPGVACDMTELIARVLSAGQTVHGFPIHEYWRDIGQPMDLFEFTEHDVPRLGL